jgi:PAS domain-containing protein
MSDLQQRLQLALESARMAIWDSSVVNGNVLDGTVSWSREGAALLRLDACAMGQPFQTFLTFVHEQDRDELVTHMQERLNQCAPYELEYRIVRADGVLRWLVAKAQTMCDGAGKPERTIGIVRDITNQKIQETLLLEQKELAEITLASIGDGVITTDGHGTITFLNRIAEQLTGWSSVLAIGVDVDQVLRVVDDSVAGPAENVARKCLRLCQAVGS